MFRLAVLLVALVASCPIAVSQSEEESGKTDLHSSHDIAKLELHTQLTWSLGQLVCSKLLTHQANSFLEVQLCTGV